MTETDGVTTSLISPQMRAVLGSELGRRTSPPIDRSDIRRWAIAVYHPEPPPPHFVDEAAAAATVHGGPVAPEEFNPFAWMPPQPGEIGSAAVASDPGAFERKLGVEPPPLSFMMNAGTAIEYGVRMRPGDVITSVLTLHDYSERQSRRGPMLFTVLQHAWTNQDGEPVKQNRITVLRY